MTESVIPEAIQAGVAALKGYLGPLAARDLCPTERRVGDVQAFDYRLPEDFLGVCRTLRIAFREGFPAVPLDFAITPSAWLHWPHVMKASLCLFSDGRQPSAASPEAAVHSAMKRASMLVGFSMAGADPDAREAEFAREIRTYWDHQLETARQPLMLVGQPTATGELYVLSQASFNLVASESKAITAFEKRQGLRTGAARALAKAAFHVVLNEAPSVRVPDPSIGSIRRWLHPAISESDARTLDAWLATTSSFCSRWIILRLPGDGMAMWALYIGDPGLAKNKSRAYSRRSARRLPLPSTPSSTRRVNLSQADVHILDGQVAHSRNWASASPLVGKRVVMVGCGSLGGECAMQLARAGVGHITVVDPDVLRVENLGRHVLGISELGNPKAQGLRRAMLNAVPDLAVTALVQSVQHVTQGLVLALTEADLVIVTTADWPSERILWQWKADKGTHWAMVQAWSEPYAREGHVLVSPIGHGSAEHLFDEQGRFRRAFSKWPDDGVLPLPACGASFVPGDAARMSAVATLTVQATIAVLSNPSCPASWQYIICDTDDIADLGGSYTGPALPPGARAITMSRPWDEPS